jgi:hypothetical protein
MTAPVPLHRRRRRIPPAQAVPVSQGSARSLRAGQDVERIADFVHGKDGFGEIGMPPPQVRPTQGRTAEPSGGLL